MISADAPKPSRIKYSGPVILILAIGVALRLNRFFFDRALWLREAHLFVRIQQIDWPHFFNFGMYAQTAPIGFVWLAKGVILIFGPGSYALRGISLVAGVAALATFASLGRRFLKPRELLFALTLLAISESVIDYSAEFKHYSVELWVALFIFSRMFPAPESERARGKILMGLVCPLLIWFSHSAIFVILAGWLVRTWDDVVAGDRRMAVLASRLLEILPTIFSLAILYRVSLQPIFVLTHLQKDWEEQYRPFMPAVPLTATWFWWVRTTLRGILNDPLGLSAPWTAGTLLAVGAAISLRRKTPIFRAFVATLVLCLIASTFKLYPFSGRLLIFALPVMGIFIGLGISFIDEATRARTRYTFAVLAAILIIPPALTALKNLWAPPENEEMRDLVGYLKRETFRQDGVYVYRGAAFQFLYYQMIDESPDARIVYGPPGVKDPVEFIADLRRVTDYPRFWFVAAHSPPADRFDEEAFQLRFLECVGRRTKSFYAPGVSATLFEFEPRKTSDRVDRCARSRRTTVAANG